MSINGPEYNPAEVPSADEYLGNVEHYLYGLRFGEYGSIDGAGTVIQSVPSPFVIDMARIQDISETLSRSWLNDDNDKRALQDMREEALAIVLRSYAYSGYPVDAGLVYSTVAGVGVANKWLRDTLWPSRDMIFQQKVHDGDRAYVKTRGEAVVRQLGLVPLYGLRIKRIIDSR